MNRTVKLILYVVLVTAALVLAVACYRAYVKVDQARQAAAVEPPDPDTNSLTVATNLVLSATNLTSGTNADGSTNTAPATNAPVAATAKPAPAPASLSQAFAYGGACFLVVVGLSLLIAYDVSHFMAERFHKFILSDDGEGFRDAEYERAEQLVNDNHFLEAIQAMRDFLKQNPRKLYAAIRIAEIYEKHLGNYLAAALEYEEVLSHRLPREQWGWTAIHLANLYSGKMNKSDKAEALLRRIVAECDGTTAAAKARSRLGEPDAPEETAAPEPGKAPPPPSMPKGFRRLTDK